MALVVLDVHDSALGHHRLHKLSACFSVLLDEARQNLSPEERDLWLWCVERPLAGERRLQREAEERPT
jgi:hypothetical protein